MTLDPVVSIRPEIQTDPKLIAREIYNANERLRAKIKLLNFNNAEHRQIVLDDNALIMSLYARLLELHQ